MRFALLVTIMNGVFRNPRYLDQPILLSLADYHGVELAVDSSVMRTVSDQSSPGDSGGGRTEQTEVRAFMTAFRPVRAFNDVMDTLTANDVLLENLEAPTRGTLIDIEAELSVTTAGEIGGLIERFMPLLQAQLGRGEENFEPAPADLADLILGEGASTSQMFGAEIDGVDMVTRLDTQHFFPGVAFDDVEDDVRLAGVIDRVLPEGATMSLERYLFPGMNRTMRRALSKNSIDSLLESFSELTGKKLTAADLTISGPAVIVSTIAIY